MSQKLTGKNLLDSYAEIGATSGFEPVPLESCKLALSSRPGRGKTTFAMSIPKAIVLDYDRGAQQCVVQKAQRVDMRDDRKGLRVWDKHDKIRDLLFDHASKKDRPFQIVVIDTLDGWFYAEVARDTEAYNKANPEAPVKTILDLNDYGKARTAVYDRIRATLRTLHLAGYGWIVLSHIACQRLHIPGVEEEVVTWGPSLGGKLPEFVNQDAEIVARIDRRTKKEKDPKTKKKEEVTQYKLIFSTNDDYQDAKSRLRLPESEIVLPEGGGWSAFRKSYDKGVEIAQEEVKRLMAGGEDANG